jgi:hypothetical protein
MDLEENGEEIKPAMTTNNNIIVESYPEVLTIPRTSLFSNNSNTYVYLKKGKKSGKKGSSLVRITKKKL